MIMAIKTIAIWLRQCWGYVGDDVYGEDPTVKQLEKNM